MSLPGVVYMLIVIQLRKRRAEARNAVADAGTPLDGRDEDQEGQDGRVRAEGLELGGLMKRYWILG